ncbi:hypothetical protein AYO22_01008 [Fonsecaea multimorphosa]|nr:hypothetical protein AYO22_01008 [Fonsecaea multimorphosa]
MTGSGYGGNAAMKESRITWLFEPSRKDELEQSEPDSPSWQSLPSHRDSLPSPVIASKSTQSFSDPFAFLVEPSSPWTTDVDQRYTQLFLLETAPLLSSTRKWHHFWQFIVPQAAWNNPSVHHGMVAVAATFDSYFSGRDHTALVLERRAQAVRAFTNQRPSWDVALIVCRLFSSMAQCNEDFPAAMEHIKSGEKILREATQQSGSGSGHAARSSSEIVRLMAATFMGLSADANNDVNIIKRFPPGQRRAAFLELKVIGSEYARLLRRIAQGYHHHGDGDTIDTLTIGFLSVAFTTMNQAISSAMYPDLLVFTGDDGVVPAAEIRTNLLREGSLLALDDLIIMFPCLFYELEQHLDTTLAAGAGARASAAPTTASSPSSSPSSLDDLKQRLKVLVDNYVVQASEVEPRMTAGTFWLDDAAIPGCLRNNNGHPDRRPPQTGVANPCLSPCLCADGQEDPVLRARREYYHEYVCQYRSGFMC